MITPKGKAVAVYAGGYNTAATSLSPSSSENYSTYINYVASALR